MKFRLGFVLLLATLSAPVSACKLEDPRVCAINEQLRATVQAPAVEYRQARGAQAALAEYEWVIGSADIVHLGDTLSLTDDELLFVIAHEVGHSAQKHGRKLVESVARPEDVSLSDVALLNKYRGALASEGLREINYQQEFEADAFAVRAMLQLGRPAITAMASALKSSFSTSTHPSRRARLAKAKNSVSVF